MRWLTLRGLCFTFTLLPNKSKYTDDGLGEYRITLILMFFKRRWLSFHNERCGPTPPNFMICFKELDQVKETKELKNWYSIATLLREVTRHMFDWTGKRESADVIENALEDVELGVEIIFSICDDVQDSKYDDEYIDKLGCKLGYEYGYKKQREKRTNMNRAFKDKPLDFSCCWHRWRCWKSPAAEVDLESIQLGHLPCLLVDIIKELGSSASYLSGWNWTALSQLQIKPMNHVCPSTMNLLDSGSLNKLYI